MSTNKNEAGDNPAAQSTSAKETSRNGIFRLLFGGGRKAGGNKDVDIAQMVVELQAMRKLLSGGKKLDDNELRTSIATLERFETKLNALKGRVDALIKLLSDAQGVKAQEVNAPAVQQMPNEAANKAT
ncbi:hypothetical protein PLEOSDRAFT_1112432 [Pleurotus ostreatus PC15]|uniref:Uncharacterized protein n=2 Tax=Pleurotus TaxID=5320 RepID=A0A067NP94_PLEO1|nr:hypothetical protein CCMSSC00406_0001290 [Pleurotus cornucopiae]KDQ29764.1 hypothetical protein PLEOSDRAFT_1112432 [Pleurotus ostreatus PC15]